MMVMVSWRCVCQKPEGVRNNAESPSQKAETHWLFHTYRWGLGDLVSSYSTIMHPSTAVLAVY